MIAAAGYFQAVRGNFADSSLNASAGETPPRGYGAEAVRTIFAPARPRQPPGAPCQALFAKKRKIGRLNENIPGHARTPVSHFST